MSPRKKNNSIPLLILLSGGLLLIIAALMLANQNPPAAPTIVGRSYKSFNVNGMPRCRQRASTWMLRIESPPRSMKWSWMPTCSMRSTDFQIATSSVSQGVRGAVCAALWRMSVRM